MLDFALIQRLAQAADDDLSINLDKQRVYMPTPRGHMKTLERTVYRANVEGGMLVGSVLRQGKWMKFKYDSDRRAWNHEIATRKPQPTAESLRERARHNLNDLTRRECEQLLRSYDEAAPQAYAVALHLKRQHRVPSALAEKVVECLDCGHQYDAESSAFLYRTGALRCPKCLINVSVKVVDREVRHRENSMRRAQATLDMLKTRGGGDDE